MGDLKALLEEVLFLHATFTHNLKLWFRTYPFHLGLYMLMGGLYGTETVAESVSGYDITMLSSVLVYLIPAAFLLRKKKIGEEQERARGLRVAQTSCSLSYS